MRYQDNETKMVRVILKVTPRETIIAFTVTKAQKGLWILAADGINLDDWITDLLDTAAGGRADVDSADL